MLGSSSKQKIWLAAALLMTTTAGMLACNSDDDVTNPIDQTATTAQIVASVRSDAHIVGVLHQSNVGEITAGSAAQSKGVDAEVKSFAAQMVTDHSSLDAQGNALAAAQGLSPALPDSTLPQVQSTEMATLNLTPTGTSFDRTYIAQQVADHQRTLAIVDASIALATNAQLKAFLQNSVRPGVAMHLQMAQAIQARIGSP